MRKLTSLIDAERLSLSDAARRLGIHAATIARWCLRGVAGRRLVSYKFGGQRVVLLSDLEAFLAAGQNTASTDTSTSSESAERRADDAARELDRRGL